MFPIAVPNKYLMVEYLLASGVNAYRGATQLAYVAPPEGRKHAENSKWLMENIIYIPIHSYMPDCDIKETVDRVLDANNRLMNYLNQPSIPKPIDPRSRQLIERTKL